MQRKYSSFGQSIAYKKCLWILAPKSKMYHSNFFNKLLTLARRTGFVADNKIDLLDFRLCSIIMEIVHNITAIRTLIVKATSSKCLP